MKVSVSVGDLAHGHDTDAAYRSKLANVDPSRTARNAVLRDESLEAFYARRFGPAVEAYNEKQRAAGRPGRCVGDYLEKVRSEYARDREAVREGRKRRSQKPAEAYEYVVQVGDAGSHPDEATAGAVLREWLDEMEGRCPGMEVTWAAIHNDEATPHLHVAMVPVGEGTRGIGTTVSWNGALKRCGVRSKVELLAAMKDTLRERCAAHGIEVEPDGPGGRAHVTVEEYKRQMAAAEKAKAEAKRARADVAKATKNLELLTGDTTFRIRETGEQGIGIKRAQRELNDLAKRRQQLISGWDKDGKHHPGVEELTETNAQLTEDNKQLTETNAQLTAENEELAGRLARLNELMEAATKRFNELTQRIFDRVMDAWYKCGPWAEKQDPVEVNAAIKDEFDEMER